MGHRNYLHQVDSHASPEIVHRFMSKVRLPQAPDDCWEWTASTNGRGYGRFGVTQGSLMYAHRVAWELWSGGTIPEGLVIDHMCRNRGCVNPLHLRVVTTRDNLLASPYTRTSINAGKEACPKGHPYTEENTARTTKGYRACRQCRRDQCKRTREKKMTTSKEYAR